MQIQHHGDVDHQQDRSNQGYHHRPPYWSAIIGDRRTGPVDRTPARSAHASRMVTPTNNTKIYNEDART